MADRSRKITLWGIEVFTAAAEERSISAAARRLGASPSAISQQLSNLEEAVGALLLDRRARPVALTPAGEAFRRHAQTILNEAAQAQSELARLDRRALTQLRLGMIEDFDSNVTPALLSQLAEEMGASRFLLETGASHRLFDQLESRALDVIVAAEMGAAAEWMEVFPLLRDPFVAVVPRGRIGADSEPGEALAEMPLIRYTTRHHMGRVISDHLVRQNLVPESRFELDSYHAIMAMVAAGAGWTILTPLGASHARRFAGRVDLLPLPFAPPPRAISLFARRGILGDMPADIAGRLRELLQRLVVGPQTERLPWLEGALRVRG